MLTTTDLQSMREAQEQCLPEEAVIRQRLLSGDGQGGQEEHYEDQPVVSCRVGTMTKEQAERYADKLGSRSGWVLTMPFDTRIDVRDRVRVNGIDHGVIGVESDHSWLTALRVYVVKLP